MRKKHMPRCILNWSVLLVESNTAHFKIFGFVPNEMRWVLSLREQLWDTNILDKIKIVEFCICAVVLYWHSTRNISTTIPNHGGRINQTKPRSPEKYCYNNPNNVILGCEFSIKLKFVFGRAYNINRYRNSTAKRSFYLKLQHFKIKNSNLLLLNEVYRRFVQCTTLEMKFAVFYNSALLIADSLGALPHGIHNMVKSIQIIFTLLNVLSKKTKVHQSVTPSLQGHGCLNATLLTRHLSKCRRLWDLVVSILWMCLQEKKPVKSLLASHRTEGYYLNNATVRSYRGNRIELRTPPYLTFET